MSRRALASRHTAWMHIASSGAGSLRTPRHADYLHGALLLVPFIQYGLNYFASIAALLFGWMLIRTRGHIAVGATLLTMAAMSLSLIWGALNISVEPNLLREFRISGGLVVLFWFLSARVQPGYRHLDGRWPLGVMMALAILTAVQAVASANGIPIVAPSWWFVNNGDVSLADTWVTHAAEHGYQWTVRPSAGYSEPSYLGGVALFLHFLCLHTLRGRGRLAATVVAISTCAMAHTAFGILSNVLIAVLFRWGRFRGMLLLMPAAGMLLVIALFVFAGEGSGRLALILSGSDTSTLIRVVQPLGVMFHVLTEAPFGMALTVAQTYFKQIGLIGPFDDAPFHSGVFNLVYQYGWMSAPLMVLLWRTAGGGLSAIFLFLLMSQNGAALDFDKLFMYVFAIQVARCARDRADGPRLSSMREIH
ncbi:hypothetical protein PTE30175_02134 [Pandoraea terrae]|uniref:Polymerase n=1 Tax=Pandoraea terrae TaxID=1537710 RepID=A0A5E4UR41_9BURK|nr:hypothetical protein [Pandoraea terrae]VVE02452.1 hypothetical protein PTE30175_02134 [Pandoraea terrae]